MNKKPHLYSLLMLLMICGCSIRYEENTKIIPSPPISPGVSNINATDSNSENFLEPNDSKVTPTSDPFPGLGNNGFQLLRSFETRTSHFSPSTNGQYIAVSNFPNSAKVYDLSSGVLLHELAIPLASFSKEEDIAFFNNDTLLATQFITDIVTSTLGSIYVWDWENEEVIARMNVKTLPGYQYPCYIYDFEISNNDLLLAMLDCERIEIWDLSTKTFIRYIEQINVTDIAFSSSGDWLATAELVNGQPPIEIWDLNDCDPSCHPLFELFSPSPEQNEWIEAEKVLFHEDILAAIIDGRLRLWNFKEEKEITWSQSALTTPLVQIAFSSIGMLATLSSEGLLILFDPLTGMKIGEQLIPGAIQIEFSSDGSTIIVGGDIKLQIWAVPTIFPN